MPPAGVSGVGAAVDLQHDGDRCARAAQFVGDLRDEAAFALVAEGIPTSAIELAGKRV